MKRLARSAKRARAGPSRLRFVFSLTKEGNEVTHHKHDGTNDRQALVAAKPPMIDAADVFDIALAQNRRLREGLKKIYSEAMMANEPPASTWYRIAGIADLVLAGEEAE